MRNRFLLIFSLVFLLAGSGVLNCGESFEDNTGSGLRIVGTVKDAAGNPIAGAKVLLLGSGIETVTTDSDGEFRIEDVPAGSYNIEVTKSGYKDVLETIEVKTDDQPTISAITMEMN